MTRWGRVKTVKAYGKYGTVSSTSSGLNNFATALLAAFSLSALSGGETGTASSGVNTWGLGEAGGFGDGSSDNGAPAAFVNILVFDKNYNFLAVSYQRMTTASATAPTAMNATYTVKEEGYVYMYVSNEHPTLVDIFFDDVMMSYTPSPLLQSNEYYSFGMQTAKSWTRENTTSNNFLANGGTELNPMSGLYDLDFRNYDPILGRMNQVDPMASKYGSLTPYNYSFNNPVAWNDPTGADPPWGPDMDELSTRNKPSVGQQRMAADAAAMLSGAGTPGSGLWSLVGQYGLAASGFGFGDLYANPSSKIDVLDVLARAGITPDKNKQGKRGFWGEFHYTRYDYESDGKGHLIEKGTVVIGSRFVEINSGNATGNWLSDHWYFELKGDVSVGPQATFTVSEGAIVPVPYSNTGGAALNVKLMAYTLLGFKASNRTLPTTTTPKDVNINQGIGGSLQGNSFELNREIRKGIEDQYTGRLSVMNGLLGLEINFTTREVFIGAMPTGSWSLVGGISGSMKAGLTF